MVSKIVDLPEVMERVQEDKELLLELFGDFSKDYLEKRKLIEQLLEEGDFEQIQRVCHSLKGASGNVSVTPMYNCFMLLQYLAAKEDKALIKDVLQDVEKQFEELQVFIKELRDKT